MHNQPREPQSYEDCQENQFKNLCELHKEWTEAGVVFGDEFVAHLKSHQRCSAGIRPVKFFHTD